MSLTDLETRISELEKKLEAALLGTKARGGPPMADTRARALKAHDDEWNGVKERWPLFKVHPASCKAFKKHVESLGKEPSFDQIAGFAGDLKIGRYYNKSNISEAKGVSVSMAQALLFFMKLGGFLKFEESKMSYLKIEAGA